MLTTLHKNAIAAVCAVILSVSGSVTAAPPKGSTLPPVRYQVGILSTPVTEIRDINNSGEMVGYFTDANNRWHACLVSGGQVVDLASLVATEEVPAGWYLSTANGINDAGTIVGSMRRTETGDSGERRGFIFYRPADSGPILEMLPDSEWSRTWGADINDDHLILGLYEGENSAMLAYICDGLDLISGVSILPIPGLTAGSPKINNSQPPQIAGNLASGPVFRYTIGDAGIEQFPQLSSTSSTGTVFNSLKGISDLGGLCGGTRNTTKTGPSFVAWRYGATYQTFATNNTASCMNIAGDLGIPANFKLSSQLYSEGRGLIKLNDILVGDATMIASFHAHETSRTAISGPEITVMTERGALNPAMSQFPALGGRVFISGYAYPFLLIPVAP